MTETYFDVQLTKQAHKEFLELPILLQAATADVIQELKIHGDALREPEVKSMGNGLKELRAKSRSGISRSFFFFTQGKKAYIVHIFQKKTQKTPKQTLDLAFKRMNALKQELNNE